MERQSWPMRPDFKWPARMYGLHRKHVSEIAVSFRRANAEYGTVDYALGAAPYTVPFVIAHEDLPLKKSAVGLLQAWRGPFYVFYTPFHFAISTDRVDHRQSGHSIAMRRWPASWPVAEVSDNCQARFESRRNPDGVGGFCCYGLMTMPTSAREENALPIGLSEAVKCCATSRRRIVSFGGRENVRRDWPANSGGRKRAGGCDRQTTQGRLANETLREQSGKSSY